MRIGKYRTNTRRGEDTGAGGVRTHAGSCDCNDRSTYERNLPRPRTLALKATLSFVCRELNEQVVIMVGIVERTTSPVFKRISHVIKNAASLPCQQVDADGD